MNNFKTPGKKLTSRFGFSHKEARLINKEWAGYGEKERRLKYATKRLAKKCTHRHWTDTGYGGPDGGAEGGHCRDCGWSFEVRLY